MTLNSEWMFNIRWQVNHCLKDMFSRTVVGVWGKELLKLLSFVGHALNKG